MESSCSCLRFKLLWDILQRHFSDEGGDSSGKFMPLRKLCMRDWQSSDLSTDTVSTQCELEVSPPTPTNLSESSFDPSEEEPSGRVRHADLDNALAELGPMRPWVSSTWKLEKKLSSTCGGYGRVDLMHWCSQRHWAPLPDELQRSGPRCSLTPIFEEGPVQVAVKCLPLRWLQRSPTEFKEKNPKAIEHPWRDISMLKHLNSIAYPYVVELLGVFEGGEKAYIMMSFATEGDLFTWSQLQSVPRLPGPEREASMRGIVQQMFAAVQWLHNLGVAHRDLSLENIMLTRSNADESAPQVKIIDFGMATLDGGRCRGVFGKTSYQAPEMHGGSIYDGFLADCFALGVTIFCMACRKYPWKATVPGKDAAYEFVKSCGLSAFLRLRSMQCEDEKRMSQALSGSCQHLLQGMLATDPLNRLTLGESRFDEKRASVWDSDWLKLDN